MKITPKFLSGQSISKRLRAFVMLVTMLVVTGCYMPIRFDAEIDISRGGYYEFFFDGYLAKVELYQGLKDGEINREEELAQAEIIRQDFTRDSATKEFEDFKQGHFKVNYQRDGDLLKTKTMTFFRRNEYILGISYNFETGMISMLGKSLKRDIKERLRASGLDSSGELRIFTDGLVTSHNATTVKPFPSKGNGYKLYTWKIQNLLHPTPALKIKVHEVSNN